MGTPTVAVSDAGGAYNGKNFTATATVAGVTNVPAASLEGITPTLTYYAGSSATGTALPGAPSAAGTYTVLATFPGSADYISASASQTFTIARANLTATGNSFTIVYGQTIPSLTGTLTGVISGDGITVSFTTKASAGSNAGAYAITPTLNDPNNKLANYNITLTPGTLTIGAASTALALTSSTAGVSYYGQPVTLKAVVSVVAPGSGTAAGSVQFFSNGVSLGTVALAGGSASLTTSALALGSDNITAVYTPGNANFATSSGSLTQSVNGCIVLLDTSKSGSLTVSGGATVDANGASIIVDSTSATAIAVSGSGQVDANLVDDAGKASITGGGKVANLQTGQAGVGDPLASLPVPTTSGLTVRSSTALSIGGSTVVTLQPGVYVGGINIGGAAKVTLAPGEYYLQGGGLTVAGSAKLSGTGVFIYNAAVKSTDQINISGAAAVSLTPMTSGNWAGITIFQARSSNAALVVSGSGSIDVTGAIYAADAAVDISGAGSADTFGSSLIVDDLNVSGSGELII